jgi:general secretion pathway protein K
LVIVLLLAATLSFVMLAITQIVSAGVHRSFNERTRTELIWRAFSAEQLASAILRQAAAAGDAGRTAAYFGLLQKPVRIELPDGEISIRFGDASRCFNVNALAILNSGAAEVNKPALAEFKSLASDLGLSDNEAQQIAEVIIDWIDPDSTQQPQGAEDDFYTALPTPYRTGGAPIAALSEIRAMDRVTREKFGVLAPILCALPSATDAVINLNAATERDIPVIAALVPGGADRGKLRDALQSRPPGGFSDPADFWTTAGVTAPANRTSLQPSMVEVRALLRLGEQEMEAQMFFDIPSSTGPRLVSREFGAIE